MDSGLAASHRAAVLILLINSSHSTQNYTLLFWHSVARHVPCLALVMLHSLHEFAECPYAVLFRIPLHRLTGGALLVRCAAPRRWAGPIPDQWIVARNPATYRPSLEPGLLRSGRQTARCGKWASRIEGPAMSISLEPLALSPRDAAAFLSISKRSLSRLIRAGKIEARKHGPRTLVDVPSLKAYYASLPTKIDHTPIVFGRRAHMLPRSRVQVRH